MPDNLAQDAIVQQAISWMVQQHSGEMTDAERDTFARWRAEHSSHDLACKRIEQTLGNLPEVAAAPALRLTLHTKGNRRQFLQSTLAIAAITATGGLIYDRYTPLADWFADLHTNTGERRSERLTDGSRLTLNARSSVDIIFDAKQRKIRLLKGQIHIDAPDAGLPLIINTAFGDVSFKAGSFNVAVCSTDAKVAALSQPGVLRLQDGSEIALPVGQGARLSGQSAELHNITVNAERAWLDGMIELDDQPLSLLVEALRDYRKGIIRVSPDAARLHISGIFPLDNTDFALEAIAQTLPVVVKRTTSYWINISRA